MNTGLHEFGIPTTECPSCGKPIKEAASIEGEGRKPTEGDYLCRTYPKISIVQADAYSYTPAKGERFDYVWHDIWDDLDPANLPLMAKLKRKYAQRAAEQGAWSQREMQLLKRGGRSSYPYR